MEKPGNANGSQEGGFPAKGGETARKASHVIIHKPYSYLEPVIRSMFEEAEDVMLLVDRRFHERRRGPAPPELANRRRQRDRRQALPMLDILINVDP